MAIDWSATGAMISGWGSWASAFAVGYAARDAGIPAIEGICLPVLRP